MATNRAVNIELPPAQMEFALCQEHYAAMVAGIGSGKSYAGCLRALMASSGRIGEHTRIKTPNLGVITAPTYGMLRDATLRTFLDIAGSAVANFNKSEMRATLSNGSEILFRSTENYERLRGPSISYWFGDEAALYPDAVWKIMIGRIRQHGQHGYVWLATTPRGRNWVYKRFGVHRAGYRLVRAKTRDNPHADREWIATLYDEYAGDYAAQELEGEFIAFEGLIYPEFDQSRHITRKPVETGQFKEVIAGVDWGYANPGVILVGGVDGDTRTTIVHEEYARRRRIEEWVSIAKELKQEWNISRFVCDPSEPDYIKQFNAAGLNAVGANNSVLPGLQKVRNRLVVRDDGKPRLLITPNAVNLMAEFDQYEWSKNKDGIRDEPRKAFDHAQDALRYLIMSVDNDQTPPTFGVETRKYA